MAEVKFTAEQQEAFRNGLDAATDLIEDLVTYCRSTKELAEMMRLALTNEAQFRLLMTITVGARTQEAKK